MNTPRLNKTDTTGSRLKKHSLVMGITFLFLSGCADVHWERAFYDGFQRCPSGHSARNETCDKGPSYDRYEQERERLQADRTKSPAGGGNPIEEKQL